MRFIESLNLLNGITTNTSNLFRLLGKKCGQQTNTIVGAVAWLCRIGREEARCRSMLKVGATEPNTEESEAIQSSTDTTRLGNGGIPVAGIELPPTRMILES